MRAARLREAAATTPHYERRRPEQTPLYRLVREHYETFAAEVDGLPQFVKDEFDAYLDCGILAHGFMRLTCEGCARDTLVAFSCKRRGICPSCGTRRMAETAADLVDNMLARVPVRQWVLSFPIPLRSLFAVHPGLITPVLRIVHRAINTHLIQQAGITRPAISNERLSINRDGNAVLKLKTPWRNGTTHIVMTPMEFMQRLAALVPRPRLHLIRFHGVLAPNARLRSQGVPVPAQKTTTGEGDCQDEHSAPVRMTWARLLKRVFDIDIERCAWGGKLKLIAVIEAPAVIEKILTHLGLSPQPPPRAPARRRVDWLEWA